MGWVQNASPEVDAASNYPTIISVCISMTIFMTTVVSLRIYVRAFLLKLMGTDDWTIIFSAVSLAGISRSLSVGINFFQVCSIIYNGLCLGRKFPH
jgi:hypothetical protein